MDAMALLCNLHADGPATLRRLRAFGVGTLDDLPGRDVAELARLLEFSPAQARRFLREADQLRERLGPDSWDPEEGEETASPAAAVRPSAADRFASETESNLQPRTVPIPSGIRERAPNDPLADDDTHAVSESSGQAPARAVPSFTPSAPISRSPESLTSPTPKIPTSSSDPKDIVRSDSEARPAGAVLAGESEASEEASGRLSARDRELLDQVLRRWRGGAKPKAVAEPESSGAPTVDTHVARTAEAANEDTQDWLSAGRLSGLGIPQIEKLEQAGVRTFTALAECDPLSLSKTSGLTFSTLQRLKFLAGRAPAAKATPTPERVERLSRSERPPVPLESGTEAALEPSVGTLMEALSPRAPRPTRAPIEDLPTHTSDGEPSLADLLPHEDEGPGGPFA